MENKNVNGTLTFRNIGGRLYNRDNQLNYWK